MQALTFFFAFVAVLALIGVAAWLVRRFATNRLGANTNRGRMPRLAVIDAAAVDGRRRLVLVRRDNMEHLIMIGGPTDIVVESNIVRAQAARDQLPQRPVGAELPPPRIAPLPDAAWGADLDAAKSDGFDHAEPAMPEPPPRPVRPPFADEVRLDRCPALIHQQVLQLHPRVERVLVHVPDQLPGGLSSLGTLIGPLERGDDVLGEVAGEVGTLDEGVEVLLHHLSLCTHWPVLFLLGSPAKG